MASTLTSAAAGSQSGPRTRFTSSGAAQATKVIRGMAEIARILVAATKLAATSSRRPADRAKAGNMTRFTVCPISCTGTTRMRYAMPYSDRDATPSTRPTRMLSRFREK